MATIAILIGTPKGAKLLAADTERGAAAAAETFLLTLAAASLPAPVWVQCGDEAAAARLTGYLAAFQAERVRERDAPALRPAPDP